jgi:hypothetical protein
VAWSFSTDGNLTGYVRPEEVRFWQSELCEITNPVAWKDLRLVKLRGDRPECRLPDGSPVSLEAWQNWLNESIAAGWQVGVSLVQSNSGTALVACRKRASPNGGSVKPLSRSEVTKEPSSVN